MAFRTRAAVVVLAVVIIAGTARNVSRLVRAEDTATVIPSRRLIFTQVPVRHSADDGGETCAVDGWAGLPVGSRIVALGLDEPGAGVSNLTPQFETAGRADLSFDGQRLLFVGRRMAGEPFSVWEMNVDGGGLRRVVDQPSDCCSAIYLATLYTMDAERPEYGIAFSRCVGEAQTRPLGTAPAAPRGGVRFCSLYTCRLDGSRVRRITFTPDGAFDPHLLSDGRLVFSSGRPGESRSVFLTVNTDGTDVSLFAVPGDSTSVAGMPSETPDGWVIFVESDRRGWDGGGVLAAVRRARSLGDRRLIAQDPNGVYHSPSPWGGGRLLVSYRRTDQGTYGVYVLDPDDGQRVGKVFDAPEWHDVYAMAVGPRAVPDGRSSVVDERVGTGRLYCLDAYLTGTRRTDDQGDHRIDRVRLIRWGQHEGDRRSDRNSESNVGRRSAMGIEEVIGEFHVESDGSFHLEVPARTPLRLQSLNAAGQVLRDMRSWIWVMPKEMRGCIGCHEDRELTPPNRSVAALRKEPQRVGNTSGAATTSNKHQPGYGRPQK